MMLLPPAAAGAVHIIGIGGAGMSALAQILLQRGYTVTGSDSGSNTSVITHLQEAGATIYTGTHNAQNIGNAAAVAFSSAVANTNPERVAAQQANIPLLTRADLMANIMQDAAYNTNNISITGTHGKSTTTAMTGIIFGLAGRDPLVLGGAVLPRWKSNACLGQGNDLIVEADESDGTMLHLPTHTAAITNIDAEHLDFYGTELAMLQSYGQFMQQSKKFIIVPQALPPMLQELKEKCNALILTYGITPRANVYASRLCATQTGMRFVLHLPSGDESIIINLNVHGKHNVENALVAAAIAYVNDVKTADIKAGLEAFTGVQRRFTTVGNVGDIKIIDDYAHHPVEIRATLRAAQALLAAINSNGRVIAVFQPHRYSRVQNLYDDFGKAFGDADHVLVTDIYSAGESAIAAVTPTSLAQHIQQYSHCKTQAVGALSNVNRALQDVAKAGDWVICMGAGDITQLAHALPQTLAQPA